MKKKRARMNERVLDVSEHARGVGWTTVEEIRRAQHCSYRYAWRIIRRAQSDGYLDVETRWDGDGLRRAYVRATNHFDELYHGDPHFGRIVQHAVDHVDRIIRQNRLAEWRQHEKDEMVS